MKREKIRVEEGNTSFNTFMAWKMLLFFHLMFFLLSVHAASAYLV
jgi:hypothetical protein